MFIQSLRLAFVGLAFSILALGCASTVSGVTATEDAAPVADRADASSTETGADVADISVADVTDVDTSPDALPDVVPRATLTVTPSNLRLPTILCPFTHEGWDSVAEYRLSGSGATQRIDVVRVASRGYSASFAQIAVAFEGRTIGTAVLPTGIDQEVDVELSTPILVPAREMRAIQLWVRLAPVIDHSAIPAGTTNVPFSGARVALGIASGSRSEDLLWNSSYEGMLDIRSTSVDSGELVRASASGVFFGNSFVVRRSKPTVTLVRPTSTDIPASGERLDLIRFAVGADTAGPIAYKALRLRVELNRVADSTLFLDQFELYEGGRLMSSSEYNVVRLGTFVREFNTPYILFTLEFIHERRIPAGESGQMLFTARVQGDVRSGDAVRVSFLESDYPGPVTGQLAGEGDILTSDGVTVVSAFTWSDYSDTPHTDDYRIMPSHDWTNAHGRLLQDLSSSVVLTVP